MSPPFDWLFEDGDANAAQGVVRGSGQPTLQVSAVSVPAAMLPPRFSCFARRLHLIGPVRRDRSKAGQPVRLSAAPGRPAVPGLSMRLPTGAAASSKRLPSRSPVAAMRSASPCRSRPISIRRALAASTTSPSARVASRARQGPDDFPAPSVGPAYGRRRICAGRRGVRVELTRRPTDGQPLQRICPH